MNFPIETRDHWNKCRFNEQDAGGHYESYFQRANHPTRPLAFWIRYTIFSPKGNLEQTMGELWAIFFDGENDQITAVKENIPFSNCSFSDKGLAVQIGDAKLDQQGLNGKAALDGNRIEWDLKFDGGQPPLLLFPQEYYERGFPKAKALVGTPHAVYQGALTVNGKRHEIKDWLGSQNHNWGSKHTDRYAWGQVAGFDNAPDVFLECSTAQVKVGPLWTPRLTLVVLRVGQQEFALNSISQGAKAFGKYRYFDWDFVTRNKDVEISGRIQAPNSAFVGLRYGNPPGGNKICLNSKLASCTISFKPTGKPAQEFVTQNRAAFEIVTDDRDHGINIAA